MRTGVKGRILVGGAKPPVARRRWSRRRIGLTVAGAVGLLVAAGWAWRYRLPETWLEISQVAPIAVGVPQQLSVVLQYRPRFLTLSSARPIPGTIQLISFGERIEVKPTTLVTTPGAPAAVFTITGRRDGVESLVFAGSDAPTQPRSWRTMSTNVSVISKR